MSHTTSISNIKIQDLNVLKLVCEKLGYTVEEGESRLSLYSSTENVIAKVKIPNFRYNVGVKEDGSLVYDIYEGRWGNQSEIDKLSQHYGLEKSKLIARQKGLTYQEQVQNDGSIRLQISGF